MNTYQTQRRKLSLIPKRFPATPLDQYMYLSLVSHDGQHRTVITFAGQVEAERMSRAMRLTLDIEPILGCWFIEHPWRPYWERRDDLDIISLCPVVEPKDMESELSEFLAASMDPRMDPLVQVKIFRSDKDTLCIKVNHTVADAAGLFDCIGLLARTYRELSVDSTYYPKPNVHGSRGHGQVLRRVSPLSLIRGCWHFSYPKPWCDLPTISQDFSGRAFTVRRITPERFANIKAYCRRHEVSVNVVLITGFYRALLEIFAPLVNVPLPIAGTINLRRYLPSRQAGAICNLSDSFFITVNIQSRSTFSDTLTQVSAAMKAVNEHKPWLGEAVYLDLTMLPGFFLGRRILQMYFNNQARKAASGKIIPYLANVGILNPEQFCFGDTEVIDVCPFGMVPYGPALIFGVNTFRNNMIFNIPFSNTAIDAQIVERFLDSFVCELPE